MGLISLVAHVAAFFTAHDVPASAVLGERERTKNNHKPGPIGGRVSFVLTGGGYTGPGKRGPRPGDTDNTVTRAVYQLGGLVEVEIWAWDDSDPRNDTVQFAAWLSLHEWTLNAIRSYGMGNWIPERLEAANVPTENRRGCAYLCTFTLPIPVHRKPDAGTVQASYEQTTRQTFPQGETPEGVTNDPIETVVDVTLVSPPDP